jgi:biotin synthase
MGAAWRDMNGRSTHFKRIIEMVSEIRSDALALFQILVCRELIEHDGYRGMGMEVCTTLGMLNADQARQLKEAGLTAYNHNLDTSREYYPKVR